MIRIGKKLWNILKRCPETHNSKTYNSTYSTEHISRQQYWDNIHQTIRATTNITDIFTWEACALGVFKRGQSDKVQSRFASLAILLAKRGLAMF